MSNRLMQAPDDFIFVTADLDVPRSIYYKDDLLALLDIMRSEPYRPKRCTVGYHDPSPHFARAFAHIAITSIH